MSVGISLSALALGIFNFWWSNRRKGRVHVGEPRTYALCVPSQGNVVLDLPLVFANDGPRTRVIRNLRLSAPRLCGGDLMVFMATHEVLGTAPNAATGRRFATAFVVPPNSASLQICEFQGTSLGPWKPGPFDVTVLVQFDEHVARWRAPLHKVAWCKSPEAWSTARVFTVRVDTGADFSRLLVHDNSDEPPASP